VKGIPPKSNPDKSLYQTVNYYIYAIYCLYRNKCQDISAGSTGTDLEFVCTECKVNAPAPHLAFGVADVSFPGVEESVPEDTEIEEHEVQGGAVEEHVSFNVADVSFGNVRDDGDGGRRSRHGRTVG